MHYWKNYILKSCITKCIIFSTFIVALLFSLLPMPDQFKWLMPNWLVLVLIYWLVFTCDIIGFSFTFALGIIIDLLLGNYLGITSLTLMPIALLTDRICIRFMNLTLLQQFLIILILISFNHLIKLWLQLYIKHPTNSFSYWLVIPASIIAWPMVCACLNLFRKVIKIC